MVWFAFGARVRNHDSHAALVGVLVAAPSKLSCILETLNLIALRARIHSPDSKVLDIKTGNICTRLCPVCSAVFCSGHLFGKVVVLQAGQTSNALCRNWCVVCLSDKRLFFWQCTLFHYVAPNANHKTYAARIENLKSILCSVKAAVSVCMPCYVCHPNMDFLECSPEQNRLKNCA